MGGDGWVDDLLGAVVASEPHPMLLVDVTDGLRVLAANPAGAARLSASPGSWLTQCLPDSAREAVEAACRRVWRDGAGEDVPDLMWPSRGKRDKWMEVRVRRAGPAVALVFTDVSERRWAREDLIASERRYKLLAENAGDFVFTSADGRLTYISPSVRALLGWRAAELMDQEIAQYLHPDDVERSAAAMAVVDTGGPARYEARFRHKRGGWVWLAVTAKPYYDEAGHIVGRVGGCRDITNRMRVEEELQESQRRLQADRATLRAILDSSLDPQVVYAAVLDEGGALIDLELRDCNAAAVSALRRTRDELVGLRLSKLFAPGVVDLDAAGWLIGVLESGVPAVIQDLYVKFPQSDEESWFDVSVAPMADGATLTWRNVTESRKAARALAASEEQLRLIMENSPVGLCLSSPQGVFLRVNPALCRLLGRTREDLLTRDWRELTHPEDVDPDAALVAEMLAGQRDRYSLTKRYLRPDGTEVVGALSVACVRGEQGEIEYFIGQIVDLGGLQVPDNPSGM